MKVLGILNVTPDSFSDGSPGMLDTGHAVERALELAAHGADAIDIGGESTRPGFSSVDATTELERVLPVIERLRQCTTIPLSIDTRKPEVADAALSAGASILNAHQELDNRDMATTVYKHRCHVIAYHTQDVRHMSDDETLGAVRNFFVRQEKLMSDLGLPREHLICDPGIGFGKTLAQNVLLLREIAYLCDGGRRQMLVGVSRKSHLGTLLKTILNLDNIPGTDCRLEAGLAEAAYAATQGATWVRTHDVLQTRDFFAIWDYFNAQHKGEKA